MLQEKLPLDSVVDTPLQVTPEVPDNASVSVPETVTVEEDCDDPSAGEEIARLGMDLSRLTVALAVAVSPAVSALQ